VAELDLGTASRTLTPPAEPFLAIPFGDVDFTPQSGLAHPVTTSASGWPAVPRQSSIADVGTIWSDNFAPADDWTLIVAIENGNGLNEDSFITGGNLVFVASGDATVYVKVGETELATGALTTPMGTSVTVLAFKANAAATALLTSADGVVVSGAGTSGAGISPINLDPSTGAVLLLGAWMWEGVALGDADIIDTAQSIAATFEAPPPPPPVSATGGWGMGGTAEATGADLYEDQPVIVPTPGGSVTPPEPPEPATPPDYAPEPMRHIWQRLGAPVLNSDGIDPDWMPVAEGYAPYGRMQIVIEGVDVTYYLGAATPDPDWTETEPFGWGPASLTFPQVTVFRPTPAWARGGANVLVRMIRIGDTTVTTYQGIVTRDGARYEGGSLTLECIGLLYAADLQLRPPASNSRPVDIGTAIARTINGVTSRRYDKMSPVITGVSTSVAGAWEPVLTYVSNLLATAISNGRQWTVRMNGRTPELVRKDTTTVHMNVRAGQTGVPIDLGSDASEATNLIYGDGVNPKGGSWAGWVYPNFRVDDTPPFPNTSPIRSIRVGDRDSDTDSGTGVSDYQRKARMKVTGRFSAANAAETGRQQSQMGLLVDGIPGPQTWAATFKTGSNTGTLDGAFVMPLAAASKVRPRLFGPDGDDLGPNPKYDPDVLVVHDKIPYGQGVSKGQAEANAREVLARDVNPGISGTVTFKNVDPEQMHRYEIRVGMNIMIKGWRGQDVLAHIVSVRKSGTTVTLTVDTEARDWPRLTAILEQRREATDAAHTRKQRLVEGKVASARPIFDSESPAGFVPRFAVFGGLWSVLRIAVGAEYGDIVRFELTASGPEQAFSVSVWEKPVTHANLISWVGNPLTATKNPWRKDLESKGLIQSYGWKKQPGGYWPGDFSDVEGETSDPVTGRLVDDTATHYDTSDSGYVYVAVIAQSSGYFEGRLFGGVAQE